MRMACFLFRVYANPKNDRVKALRETSLGETYYITVSVSERGFLRVCLSEGSLSSAG